MADRIPVKAIYSGTYGSSDVTSLGELSSGETINGSYITDNSVTLAKMASGTDGNLITYDASGDPAYVTTGTSGQILTSGGAGVAPTFQTAAGGDLSFGGDTFGANKTIGSNDNYALSFETNATERLQLTNDGRGLSQFTAKAWCFIEWNNTIYDSHNVSSITELGTGHSRVNFTNNMGNSNFAVASSSEGSHITSPSARATSTVSMRILQPTTGSWSDAQISVIIFGD
jgi:hypothetical protein